MPHVTGQAGISVIGQKTTGQCVTHTVTNHLFFEVDEQSFYFGSGCHSKKWHRFEVSQWKTNHEAVLCGLECRVVGLRVDGTSRNRRTCGLKNIWI